MRLSRRGGCRRWTPGDEFWVPHNRGTSRRIQTMGFVDDDAAKGLWMTLNGGSLLLAPGADPARPKYSTYNGNTLFETDV